MKLSIQQLDVLRSQLPPLEFSLKNDCDWPQSDAAQIYLNYYHINFAHDFTGVSHGFGYVEAAGFRIATHYWLPEDAKGTLVVVHGYYDHVGIFDHVHRFALENNLAVLAFDLPGHGLSNGERAAIKSFTQYSDVLATLLQQSADLLPTPLYAFGQSTGSAVILNYLWQYAEKQNAENRFQKIILCSPLILPRGWRLGRFAFAILRHFIKHLKRGKACSSHDKQFNDFLNHDDALQPPFLSLQWLAAMKDWNQEFCGYAPLAKQVLIIQGTGDMTVDWLYNLPTIKSKLPNAQIVMINDAGHQLVNESEHYRKQVFAAVSHYLFF